MSAVERDVSDLRAQQLTASDATAARMLAAGADRDVSEVRSGACQIVTLMEGLSEPEI